MNKENDDIKSAEFKVESDDEQKDAFTSWLPEDELWRKENPDEPHAINVENWDPVPEWVSDWINWYSDPDNDGKKYW